MISLTNICIFRVTITLSNFKKCYFGEYSFHILRGPWLRKFSCLWLHSLEIVWSEPIKLVWVSWFIHWLSRCIVSSLHSLSYSLKEIALQFDRNFLYKVCKTTESLLIGNLRTWNSKTYLICHWIYRLFLLLGVDLMQLFIKGNFISNLSN